MSIHRPYDCSITQGPGKGNGESTCIMLPATTSPPPLFPSHLPSLHPSVSFSTPCPQLSHCPGRWAWRQSWHLHGLDGPISPDGAGSQVPPMPSPRPPGGGSLVGRTERLLAGGRCRDDDQHDDCWGLTAASAICHPPCDRPMAAPVSS